MLQLTISLRALVFILLLAAVALTGSDVAHGAPSAAELTGSDGALFNNPGQNGARDIHTDSTNNDGPNNGGIRIYTGKTLTNPPTTAALQFYGNGHTVFGGQAYIDSGSTANAALIFRTAPSGGVAERMRITADGRVGIGTASPQEQLQITGNLRLPPTTATTGIIKSGSDRLLHTFGFNNFFAGIGAGNLTTTGSNNTATGNNALEDNTIGTQNTATGLAALHFNTTGSNNTASGAQALDGNTTGHSNVGFGAFAGQRNTTGSQNTFIGANTDFSVGQSGLVNATAIGAFAEVGASNSLVLGGTGSEAVSVGIGTPTPANVLHVASAGTNPRIILESTANSSFSELNFKTKDAGAVKKDVNLFVTDTGALGIFTQSGGAGGSSKVTLLNDGRLGVGLSPASAELLDVNSNVRVGTGTTGCVVDRDATVIAGTCSSDLALKKDIERLNPVLAKLAALQPSTFLWRADEFPERGFGTERNYGLIAQEVEQVMPELVSSSEDGLKLVHYEMLPILTLEGVRELKAENDALRSQMEDKDQRIAALEQHDAMLEARLATIEQRLNGGTAPLVAAR